MKTTTKRQAPTLASISLITSITLSGLAIAQDVDFGHVARSGNNAGQWTLQSGRVINYTVSSEWSGATHEGTEIRSASGDSTGTRNFDSNGEDLWFVTGNTGSTGYSITFDLRNVDSRDLVFGAGHLYQDNFVQLFGVPTGGTLQQNATTGLVSFGGSTHDDLSDWTTFRAPTSIEDPSVNSSFLRVANTTFNAATGLEKFVIQSSSGDGNNSTPQLLQTGSTNNLDYVVARFDIRPTANAERWNLNVGELSSVPEPSSALLLGLAGLASLARRKRS